jgi:hemerythrin-like domain-containing protein
MYGMHHAFRRDLAAFARAVPATPVEDRATWQALQHRWTRFAEVLHHHHTGEDNGLWPLLHERAAAAGDLAAREVLDAMEAEHELIDPLLEACAAGLASMAAGGTADQRAALAASTAATRDCLGRHLEHEETEALALVQRYLTQADWHRMEREHFEDPRMPLRTTLFIVPWVCWEVPDDVRRRAFAEAGRLMAVLYVVSRRSFARHQRRAFPYT